MPHLACFLPPAGTNLPQLQLRYSVIEPSAQTGEWVNVEASCSSATGPLCVEGGAGTTADPLQVLAKFTSLTDPWRVSFT